MNRLLLFAELILDYWGERERKRKEIELGCARCRVGRGEGVLLGFFVVVVVV